MTTRYQHAGALNAVEMEMLDFVSEGVFFVMNQILVMTGSC